jgi:hypothetical protein
MRAGRRSHSPEPGTDRADDERGNREGAILLFALQQEGASVNKASNSRKDAAKPVKPMALDPQETTTAANRDHAEYRFGTSPSVAASASRHAKQSAILERLRLR